MKHYWRRPYYRIKEEDRGEIVYSIVAYEKRDALFKIIDRGPHPEGQFMRIPVRWSHYLHIDLWFVVLDFSWKTGKHLV